MQCCTLLGEEARCLKQYFEYVCNINPSLQPKGEPIKGTVSRDGFFLEGLNVLISTFYVCADCFQGLSKAFHYPMHVLLFLLL